MLCHLPHVGSISCSEVAALTPTIMSLRQQIGNKDGEERICSFSLNHITLKYHTSLPITSHWPKTTSTMATSNYEGTQESNL